MENLPCNRLLLWLCTIAFARNALCQTTLPETNLFTYPLPGGYAGYFLDNPVWLSGSTQNITWTTSFTNYSIVLWQQKITGKHDSATIVSTIYSNVNGQGQQSMPWVVQTYASSLEDSPVYYFWAKSADKQEFPSHYFNITTDSALVSSLGPSSTTAPSATMTTGITTASSSPSASASTDNSSEPPESSATEPPSGPASDANASPTAGSTATPNGTTSASNDDSNTTPIALGVGIGVGLPLVLLGGIWLGYWIFKQRRPSSQRGGTDTKTSSWISRPQDFNSGENHVTASQKTFYDSLQYLHEAPGRPTSPIEIGDSERR